MGRVIMRWFNRDFQVGRQLLPGVRVAAKQI
jgi:hypothetical protein